MTDFADEVAEGLADVRSELGVPITVVMLDGTRVAIAKAVKTNPVAKSFAASGQALRMQTHDWLIAAADLTTGDNTFLPLKDMTIECPINDGAQIEIYRIQPFGTSKGEVHEKSDAAGTQFRVHSNYIRTVDA
tara:strand:- start:9871 stop:10269 length:399 start_codon:yes stop_codon:yes gene_type:complete